jgi:polynucleotide 5'-kinase involved in rRNA processing
MIDRLRKRLNVLNEEVTLMCPFCDNEQETISLVCLNTISIKNSKLNVETRVFLD